MDRYTYSIYTHSLDSCIWMQCTHVCVYVRLHMYVHLCILHEYLCMLVGSWFVLVCMSVCLFIVPHPAFWHIAPWLRGRPRINSRGSEDPIPYLEVVSPIDSKGNVIASHLIPHPCVSESHFVALWKTHHKETGKAPGGQSLRKDLCGAKSQFAGMPKWESNSKQNSLLIYKKIKS